MSKVRVFESLEAMAEAMAADHKAATTAALTHPIKVEDLRHGDYCVSIRPELGVIIFAKVIEVTDFEEDDESIVESRKNGFVFCHAYSVMCPHGELGDIHITRIHGKVSEACFERAKANGWRNVRASN